MITAHIGPDLGLDPSWAHITTYDGGTSTRIEWRDGFQRHYRQSRVGGGLRGTVQTFSRASRGRLFRLLGKVNRFAHPTPPLFVTVTYPGVWLQKPPQVRRNVRALLKRMQRKFGARAIIWRLEYQSRGAPHFHMMVFDPPDAGLMRDWLLVAWAEIVGTENPYHRERGGHVKALDSWRAAAGYMGKYLAKREEEDHGGFRHQGRFWGVEGRKHLPTRPISYAVWIKEGLQARRWLLRAAGRSRRGSGPLKSSNVLVDSRAVARMVDYLGHPEWTWEGHRCRPPPKPISEYLNQL